MGCMPSSQWTKAIGTIMFLLGMGLTAGSGFFSDNCSYYAVDCIDKDYCIYQLPDEDYINHPQTEYKPVVISLYRGQRMYYSLRPCINWNNWSFIKLVSGLFLIGFSANRMSD